MSRYFDSPSLNESIHVAVGENASDTFGHALSPRILHQLEVGCLDQESSLALGVFRDVLDVYAVSLNPNLKNPHTTSGQESSVRLDTWGSTSDDDSDG